MDTTRWQVRDEFRLLDLTASFAFKTPSSVSFDLGKYGDVLNLSDGPIAIGPRSVFNVIGHVDVHYPCEGHIKAQVRFLLPLEYQDDDRMVRLVEQLFADLEIPGDETFEACFLPYGQTASLVQDTDRDGVSDSI